MIRTSMATTRTNKRTKNKVTLCKMIQTSSFYDVHTVNEANMITGAYIRWFCGCTR